MPGNITAISNHSTGTRPSLCPSTPIFSLEGHLASSIVRMPENSPNTAVYRENCNNNFIIGTGIGAGAMGILTGIGIGLAIHKCSNTIAVVRRAMQAMENYITGWVHYRFNILEDSEDNTSLIPMSHAREPIRSLTSSSEFIYIPPKVSTEPPLVNSENIHTDGLVEIPLFGHRAAPAQTDV